MSILSRRFRTARCVLVRGRQVLLVEHRTWHGGRRDRWGLPGGRIERGEAPHECIRRELQEELSIAIDDLLEIGDYRYKGARHMIFGTTFAGEVTRFDQDELAQVRWFDVEEVLALESGDQLHAGFEARAVSRLLELQACD